MSSTADIERAAALLRRGGLVAFPTETVYGLGADATNESALGRLYEVKRRPRDHPVIVHLGSAAWIDDWADSVSALARELASVFWPGPLTLILPASRRVSRQATGGLDTVGLRVPAHDLARDLIERVDRGLAAPSANRFGRVSPTTAAAVVRDLGRDVDLVLDGGACAVGVESTVLDCTDSVPRILRPGAVTHAMLAGVTGREIAIGGGTTRAPGTHASHYAPAARVEVVTAAEIAGRATELADAGCRVGVLGIESDLAGVRFAPAVIRLAAVATVDAYAGVLYAAMRRADDLDLDTVLAVAPELSGIGIAIADRLGRAAAGR